MKEMLVFGVVGFLAALFASAFYSVSGDARTAGGLFVGALIGSAIMGLVLFMAGGGSGRP